MERSAASTVTAVLVSFHPDRDTLRTVLTALLPQVSMCLVIDNGSEDIGSAVSGLDAHGRVEVVALGRNYGIAAAHNRGIALARERGATHVLLMDQDSVPSPDMVARLTDGLWRLESDGARVAAVGPRFVEPRTGRSSYFVRTVRLRQLRQFCSTAHTGEVMRADFLISSGSLISLAVLDTVGGMDESLFIDHVDTDWFLRAAASGYTAYGICAATMHHSLGDRAVSLPVLGDRHVPIYGATRLYYIFRNAILLWRRPHASGWWILHDTLRFAKILVYYSLFVPPRLRNVRAILRGIVDGVRSRSGPAPDLT